GQETDLSLDRLPSHSPRQYFFAWLLKRRMSPPVPDRPLLALPHCTVGLSPQHAILRLVREHQRTGAGRGHVISVGLLPAMQLTVVSDVPTNRPLAVGVRGDLGRGRRPSQPIDDGRVVGGDTTAG
ncbi:unnamed protein product, partial [Staurois parvus]